MNFNSKSSSALEVSLRFQNDVQYNEQILELKEKVRKIFVYRLLFCVAAGKVLFPISQWRVLLFFYTFSFCCVVTLGVCINVASLSCFLQFSNVEVTSRTKQLSLPANL